MILCKFKRLNSLKTVSSGVANCRNLPFCGRAMWGSWVRLPRKENLWSHHQRLFKENVGKTEMCGLRTLSVKGSGVVFTPGEGISTPRVHHKGRQPLIKCAISCLQFFLFSLFYVFMFFPFMYFLAFYGPFVFFIFLWSTRVFPFAPTYSSICDEEIRPT